MRRVPAVLLLLTLVACGSTGSTGAERSHKRVLPPAPPPPTVAEEPVVCATDVQACADGTSVSRDPAQGCAFAACPGQPHP